MEDFWLWELEKEGMRIACVEGLLGVGYSLDWRYVDGNLFEFVLTTIVVVEHGGFSSRYERGWYRLRVKQSCGIYIHHVTRHR